MSLHATAECSLKQDLLVFTRSVVVELLKTSTVTYLRCSEKRIINTKPGLHHH